MSKSASMSPYEIRLEGWKRSPTASGRPERCDS